VLARDEFTNIWETLIEPDFNIYPTLSPSGKVYLDQETHQTAAANQLSIPFIDFADMLDLPVAMRSPDSGVGDLADLNRESPVFGDDVMMSDMTNLPLYTDAMLTSSMSHQDNYLDFDLIKNEDLFDLTSLDNLSNVASNCIPVTISENSSNVTSQTSEIGAFSSISTQNNIKCEENVYNIKSEENVHLVPTTELYPSPTSTTPRSPSPSGSDWSVDVQKPVRRNRKKLTAEQVLRRTKNSPIKPKRTQQRNNKKLKLYEVDCPLNNPEAEKCRLNAINAKKNRERKKNELYYAETEIARLKSENAELREQAENVREDLDHALNEIQELKSLMKLAGIPVEDREE